jgi:uncharacterized membrane protein
MGFTRVLRHLFATRLGTSRRFPRASLAAIEAAVAEAERRTSAQIRFAIETALDLPELWAGKQPRERALEVFAELRVWDTELRNGVLIYVLVADHDVEIVADRAAAARISPDEWEAACRQIEEHFRSGRFEAGAVAGVASVGALLARHFPPGARGRDEQPDQPALL